MYRKRETGNCKVYYGADDNVISCEFVEISQAAAAATIGNPNPDNTIMTISIKPTSDSPIRNFQSGTLTLKDSDDATIETVTGTVGSQTFGNLVFSFNTGFDPALSVTFYFEDVVGKDITGEKFSNSFDCKNTIAQ